MVRFGFRLCLAMRDPHLLRRLTAKQFQRWMLYERIEPFGELREDYRAAQVVAMIHNVAVKPEHQKSIEDLLLRFTESSSGSGHKQTVEEQAMILNIIAAALNAPGMDA